MPAIAQERLDKAQMTTCEPAPRALKNGGLPTLSTRVTNGNAVGTIGAGHDAVRTKRRASRLILQAAGQCVTPEMITVGREVVGLATNKKMLPDCRHAICEVVPRCR